MSSPITEPYGVECQPDNNHREGSYVVVQALDAKHAIQRVREEYKREPASCKKVEGK